MKELRHVLVIGKEEVNVGDYVGVGPVGLKLPMRGCAGSGLVEGLKSKLGETGLGWW